MLFIAQSLDGFIADSDGGVSWLDSFNGQGENYGYDDFLSGVGALFMGSNTYEQSLGFGAWPYPPSVRSFVFTRRSFTKASGVNVSFAIGSPVDAVKQAVQWLKQTGQSNKAIWLVGGADLIRQFLQADLVDEMMLFDMPVFLGRGIELFGQGKPPSGFSVKTVRVYPLSVILRHYVRAEKYSPNSIFGNMGNG